MNFSYDGKKKCVVVLRNILQILQFSKKKKTLRWHVNFIIHVKMILEGTVKHFFQVPVNKDWFSFLLRT